LNFKTTSTEVSLVKRKFIVARELYEQTVTRNCWLL